MPRVPRDCRALTRRCGELTRQSRGTAAAVAVLLVVGKFGSDFRFELELNRTEHEVQVQVQLNA
jgi:hypothetical protein